MTNEHLTISEKVLAQIEHTTPRSRRYFVVRNVGIWLLASVAVVVGALAVSSIIFRSVNAGPMLRPDLPLMRLIFIAVPFLWIVLMIAFAYVAYREIRSTKKGYTYEFSTIAVGTVLASVGLGIVFYSGGAGFALDRFASRHLPLQADLEALQQERWFQPENGFLIGTIQEEAEGTQIQLADPAHVVWHVQFSDVVAAKKVEGLDEGERVGLRGRTLDAVGHTFLACDVRSLEFGGRGFMGMPHGARMMRLSGERMRLPERSTECEE